MTKPRKSQLPTQEKSTGRPPPTTTTSDTENLPAPINSSRGKAAIQKADPRDAKSEETILRDLLDQKIGLNERGKTRRITVHEGILRRIAEDCLKGNTKSAAFLLNRYHAITSGEPVDSGLSEDDEHRACRPTENTNPSSIQRKTDMNEEAQDAQRALDAILRNNFESFLHRCVLHLNPGAPFLPNWHIQAIAYQLDRIRRGEITRLIINMPPRYLKSLTVSVAFTAFLLGHLPWRRIFAISYGDDLSAKHASDFRSIVHSSWYKRAFPNMRILRSIDGELTTTKRGFRKSTSVSGPLTGLGGDLFIIDDPQKPADAQSEARRNSLNQWVSNTLMSRLDNKETGAVIVVMQRVHMDDLSGFLSSSSDDWEVLSLPAIAEVDERIPIGIGEFYQRSAGEALHPAHESLATLRKLQQTLGPDVFAAQYQQSPSQPAAP